MCVGIAAASLCWQRWVDETDGPPGNVATRWFGDWKVPTKEPELLDGVAGQIDAIALKLAPISAAGVGWPGHGQRDGFDAVGLAARRFAVCLRRLAASERSQSQPVWSHDSERPIAEMSISRSEPHETLLEVDAFVFFTMGDLLLEVVAAAELAKRNGKPGGWREFVDYLDDHGDAGLRTTARELNWVLRSSRNLLVTHPARGFGLGLGRGSRGDVYLSRVGGSDEDYAEAGRLMREVAAEVGMDHEADWEHADLLDLVERASHMDRSQRDRIYRAMVLGGTGSISLYAIARLIRDLLTAHLAERTPKALGAQEDY